MTNGTPPSWQQKLRERCNDAARRSSLNALHVHCRQDGNVPLIENCLICFCLAVYIRFGFLHC
ncbi:MAG: hypothetical protein M3R14_00970 [Acidobacteriota bacterium]|nr:hypothetical protein [Acidobacteriota bacterium]